MFEKYNEKRFARINERHNEEARKKYDATKAEWDEDGQHLIALAQRAHQDAMVPISGQGSLLEMRSTTSYYARTGGTVSVPVGFGLRMRSAAGQRHRIAGPEHWTVMDTGSYTIDDKGVNFVGPRISRQWLYAKMIGIEMVTEVTTLMAVSNRQRSSAIKGGELTGPLIMMGFMFATGRIEELRTSLSEQAAAHASKAPVLELPPPVG